MKQHYLTLTVVTEPIIQSNARGESDGNRVCLQKILTGGSQRTLLTGVSLRWAIREGMAALLGDEKVFRHHNSADTMTGYAYGPNMNPSLKQALIELAKEGKSPDDFVDHIMGMMSVEEGVVGNDPSKGQYKNRSSMFLSDGISLTPYAGEATFHQGVSPEKKPPADKKSSKKVEVTDGTEDTGRVGDIAPYSVECHFTRYQYRLSFDLDHMKAEEIDLVLDIIMSGLRVGGGHARAESEITPAAIMWTFYNIPGGSKVYLPQYEVADVTQEPDLTPFYEKAKDTGVDLYIQGKFFIGGDAAPKYCQYMKDVKETILNQAEKFLAQPDESLME